MIDTSGTSTVNEGMSASHSLGEQGGHRRLTEGVSRTIATPPLAGSVTALSTHLGRRLDHVSGGHLGDVDGGPEGTFASAISADEVDTAPHRACLGLGGLGQSPTQSPRCGPSRSRPRPCRWWTPRGRRRVRPRAAFTSASFFCEAATPGSGRGCLGLCGLRRSPARWPAEQFRCCCRRRQQPGRSRADDGAGPGIGEGVCGRWRGSLDVRSWTVELDSGGAGRRGLETVRS